MRKIQLGLVSLFSVYVQIKVKYHAWLSLDYHFLVKEN